MSTGNVRPGTWRVWQLPKYAAILSASMVADIKTTLCAVLEDENGRQEKLTSSQALSLTAISGQLAGSPIRWYVREPK
jgi:hypothetical protein